MYEEIHLAILLILNLILTLSLITQSVRKIIFTYPFPSYRHIGMLRLIDHFVALQVLRIGL